MSVGYKFDGHGDNLKNLKKKQKLSKIMFRDHFYITEDIRNRSTIFEDLLLYFFLQKKKKDSFHVS